MSNTIDCCNNSNSVAVCILGVFWAYPVRSFDFEINGGLVCGTLLKLYEDGKGKEEKGKNTPHPYPARKSRFRLRCM